MITEAISKSFRVFSKSLFEYFKVFGRRLKTFDPIHAHKKQHKKQVRHCKYQ